MCFGLTRGASSELARQISLSYFSRTVFVNGPNGPRSLLRSDLKMAILAAQLLGVCAKRNESFDRPTGLPFPFEII